MAWNISLGFYRCFSWGVIAWNTWFDGLTRTLHDISYDHAFCIVCRDNRAILQARQYGENSTHTWESEEIEVLTSVPESLHPPTQQLEAMSESDMESLLYLRAQLEKHTDYIHFAGSLQKYWDNQVNLQQQLVSGGFELVELPFIMPTT